MLLLIFRLNSDWIRMMPRRKAKSAASAWRWTRSPTWRRPSTASRSTTAQGRGYGLAIAAAYVELMLARGMAVDDFAPRISFNFTAWGKIFEEVAKFRAGRRLYARMLRERFKASNPRSWMFRSLIGGGGSAFAVQEPENNIVRGAYIALAGALAGAQTMALPTYDEAYTIPSPKAQLIALRTMQICAEESGAADTADPLAGSYYV